jgi:hypothetical protein
METRFSKKTDSRPGVEELTTSVLTKSAEVKITSAMRYLAVS